MEIDPTPTRNITTRIYRDGATPDGEHWEGSTPEERIEGVWLLTRLCLLWNNSESDEPRLQRTITRVQLRKR